MNIEQYQRITDHMLTAIILVRSDLSIEYLNPACEALLELSQFRALKQPLLSILIDQDDQFDAQVALSRLLANGQPYTRREAVLKIGLRDKVVDYTASLIVDNDAPDDRARHRILFEIQPMDRLLRISREEHLTQQHAIARQLVRGVAHEIKNPLGGIRGATQLLARTLPEAGAEYTDVIISEVDRLRHLADTMLGSRKPPAFALVNVHEPLERVRALILSQFLSQFPADQLQVIRDYDLSLPEIRADKDQLIQVMLNIAANAVQAMTENKDHMQGRTPTLIFRSRILRMFTIHSVLHRSVIQLDIEDNGPGIPEELIESVFYPMVTGRANGTGLGLSIAQDIIHQHAGMIECHSIPGKTVFSLFLPWE
ncbi:nitrogen regulation protein NR(II) [Aquirhabdus parva]|uniref:Sensory histidine kinase/phosphatase NtrB n=1 Tax=Aquirhabdus parva TaxID=2283318 RepID=A0A345P5N7_9GAMM|nr:nitrogen regulation protein NR(II) [Aquirhabdus parva]AXI02596.1 PAS domain-containing sensor histidine kinase [Aquirhabdus parva]